LTLRSWGGATRRQRFALPACADGRW